VVIAFGGIGTGTALACGGDGGHAAAGTPNAFALHRQHLDLRVHRLALGALLPGVTSYLGISRAELVAQLRAGKTLAQIAGATQGKSADGLVAAVVKAVQVKLDAAVAKGRLSATEEQRLLGRLTTRVKFLVDGFPMIPMKPGPMR
jgi:hypothetical protein